MQPSDIKSPINLKIQNDKFHPTQISQDFREQ